MCALLFLYDAVLGRPLDRLSVVRAKRPDRLPVILSREEVRAILGALDGTPRLVCTLLYGSGLRLFEALGLRVHDVDLSRREFVVRDGKGQKDRLTVVPESVVGPLGDQLAAARRVHDADVAAGFGRVSLPSALARKYPSAPLEWGWQYVFPASARCVGERTGRRSATTCTSR
jgi:integrase